MEEMNKSFSDAVIIEIVHGIKEVVVLLIEKLCQQSRVSNATFR